MCYKESFTEKDRKENELDTGEDRINQRMRRMERQEGRIIEKTLN